ncbi:DUF2017 domain-containing protein [Salinibacterium hongtaonis]|uniref:DUF2017 domain-containing protein n=1 Tax=Homoserinimonas hongtaonis TaxID=2079791 RepID=A0A2U1T3H3_9MICO|nr:DUF2017 domain-containing protein [Salinibacterium hongtaonis]
MADDAEIGVLTTLARQIAELVTERSPSDPAVLRLLPDAYADDAEAASEFRRFTEADLAARKASNAQTVVETLESTGDDGRIRVEASQAIAWLKTLTDIRLVLAVRLDIDSEDDDDGRETDPMMRDVYDWLGFVQNSLVEALDA